MLLEQVVPCLHRELGYHHGGPAGVTAFQNLEQVPAFARFDAYGELFAIWDIISWNWMR